MATDIWAEVDVVNVLAASATQLTTNEGLKLQEIHCWHH